jgi:hypothetical protein
MPGKGESKVKPKLFASMVFFYVALLSTMFVMPMLVTAQGGINGAQAQTWDRFLDIPMRARPDSARLPHTEAPALSPATRLAPAGKSFPDAAMINKPLNKLRAKTIKA